MKFQLLTIAAVASTAMGWNLRLYRLPGYIGLIESASGLTGRSCVNLGLVADNEASSLHWDGLNYQVVLYENKDCKNKVATYSGVMNQAALPAGVNNVVSSYAVLPL